MKTVRFSSVVDHSGRPEVYLLFDRDDSVFKKALAQGRVMTVVEKGSGPVHAEIGYDPAQRGQILIFPRSLKKFAEARIVGIKFDLVEQPPAAGKAEPKRTTRPRPASRKKAAPAPKPARDKVIDFPQPPPRDPLVEKLQAHARRALLALEKGRTKEASRELVRLLKLIGRDASGN
jgi:hypothetical protein